MKKITAAEAYERFRTQGWNSSHVVWFLTELSFVECRGWTFAYLQRGKFTVFVLEPLFDRSAPDATGKLRTVWAEIEAGLKPGVSLFLSVYDSFLEPLKELGFQSLQVGKEPFVSLGDCSPTGKSGKGVRAARNQALRAGLRVEEWPLGLVLAHPTMAEEMRSLLSQWKNRKLVEFGSFLHTVDPFKVLEGRRIFVALDAEHVLQGFQVASPIPGRQSYFLEDLVIGPDSARGVAELLTLEALQSLSDTKSTLASLGVVALTSITKESEHNLPPLARCVLLTIPKFMSKFYNVGGLELFRKRFKPQLWENVHFALKNSPESGMSDSRAWLQGICAYLLCHRIRLNLSWQWLRSTLMRPLEKHPLSWGVTAALTASFALVNRWGNLPAQALERFGFSGDAPVAQWPLRSLASDFLVFNWQHFAVSAAALFTLLRWAERIYRPHVAAWFLLGLAFFDDILNQLVMVMPFRYFQPRIFSHLVAIKDVGPSLWIATLVGLKLSTMKKNQEVLYALLSAGCVLAIAFASVRYTVLLLNLNHTLFLSVGFIGGKILQERERAASRKVARGKPPACLSPAIQRKVTNLALARAEIPGGMPGRDGLADSAFPTSTNSSNNA